MFALKPGDIGYELFHHGIKGMKWGVRRTPEELGHKKIAKALAPSKKSGRIRFIVEGHDPTPKRSTPNSIADHIGRDGKVDKRTYYGSTGMKEREIHTTNHGNPKRHPYGIYGEHAHDYTWNPDGSRKDYITRELTSDERKENEDIL